MRMTGLAAMAAGAFVALGMMGTSEARAAVIDFTDTSAYGFDTRGFSGAVGGLGYAVSSDGTGRLSRNVPFDGRVPPTGTGLALKSDGLGVGDDEITAPRERIAVTFERRVRVTALHFLDLFANLNVPEEREQALVSFGAPEGPARTAVFDGMRQKNDPMKPDLGGYAFYDGLNLLGQRFVFSALAPGNDQMGRPDYALAAIEVAPVPLPAGLALMATALGGLALLRRRSPA